MIKAKVEDSMLWETAFLPPFFFIIKIIHLQSVHSHECD